MSDNYRNRSIIIRYVYIIAVVLLIVRLATIQLFNSKYAQLGDAQALRNVTLYPSRGYIYDRNENLIVYNEAVFDLMIVPNETLRYIGDGKYEEMNDTALLCRKLGISNEEYNERYKKACNYSHVAASIFMSQIPSEEYASWQGDLHKFKGFYVMRRTLRSYTKPVGAHLLGYVGEVSQKDMDADSYYKMGDYKGLSGLELYYEKQLRGIKGKQVMHVDVHSRTIGPYKNGMLDSVPVEGSNLYTSIDLDLQEYVEKLMANKRGAVVAIEPATGEVLAMMSAPTYDPNLLVGRKFSENYSRLHRDINKPLFNRAVLGTYPPGSTFKVAQALTALQLGVIGPGFGAVCTKNPVGCHNHPSAMSVQEGIKMSCNPYFYQVYRRVILQGKYHNEHEDSKYGLMLWHDYMLRFGFGQRLDIDLPSVMKGSIPDSSTYNYWYKNSWSFSNFYSNSIGQGEVLLVPLQMANLACCVANRGYYITPHIVRFLGNDSVKYRYPKYCEKHEVGIDKKYFDIAVAGMYDVVHTAGGTARKARVEGLDICGKTGTAENKSNGIKRSDHSAFIAFAPRDNPKIALVVYVENAAGGGGSWAAPIAGLIIEKYLTGKVSRPEFESMYMNINPCQPVLPPKK